jgi:hypothetical protein
VARHRRWTIAGAVVVVALALYPWGVGALTANLLAGRLSSRLGRPVAVGRGRAGFGQVTLEEVVVSGAPGAAPLIKVSRIEIPLGVLFGGKGPLRVEGTRAYVVRGGAGDNVTSIIERLRGRGAGAGSGQRGGGRPQLAGRRASGRHAGGP